MATLFKLALNEHVVPCPAVYRHHDGQDRAGLLLKGSEGINLMMTFEAAVALRETLDKLVDGAAVHSFEHSASPEQLERVRYECGVNGILQILRGRLADPQQIEAAMKTLDSGRMALDDAVDTILFSMLSAPDLEPFDPPEHSQLSEVQ